MLYAIKRTSNDSKWRLYRSNGDQIGSLSWGSRPSQMNLIETLADEYQGASILGNPDARWEYTEIVTGKITYLSHDDTLPWDGGWGDQL